MRRVYLFWTKETLGMGWWLPRAEIWILRLGYIFRYKISIQKKSFPGKKYCGSSAIVLHCQSLTVGRETDHYSFFFFQRIFWFYLRLSTIIGISTGFERESVLILECCHEWRWVFGYVLPKSNEHSTSPTPVGTVGLQTWTLGAHRGTAALLPSLVGYWKGQGSNLCFLSELWWLQCELKGLSMNIPWEGLCSQVSCSNAGIPLAEITTLPKESKHALSHQDSSCALIDAEIFSLWISWVYLQSNKNIFKGSLLCREAFTVTHFKNAVSAEDT